MLCVDDSQEIGIICRDGEHRWRVVSAKPLAFTVDYKCILCGQRKQETWPAPRQRPGQAARWGHQHIHPLPPPRCEKIMLMHHGEGILQCIKQCRCCSMLWRGGVARFSSRINELRYIAAHYPFSF